MDEQSIPLSVLWTVLEDVLTDLETHVKRQLWHLSSDEADQAWGMMRVLSLHLATGGKLSPENQSKFEELEKRRKAAAAQIPTIINWPER